MMRGIIKFERRRAESFSELTKTKKAT